MKPARRRVPDFFTTEIRLRRRYISDRTWFGMALVAIGLGNAVEAGGWAWVLLIVTAVGAAMTASGVRRARRRPAPHRPW